MLSAEGARSEGISLSDYAKAHGLVIREIYDAIAGLRRKGLLTRAMKKEETRQVRHGTRGARAGFAVGEHGVPVCRVVQAGGVIECLRWPPPNWLAALIPRVADEAARSAAFLGVQLNTSSMRAIYCRA